MNNRAFLARNDLTARNLKWLKLLMWTAGATAVFALSILVAILALLAMAGG